MCRTQAEAVIPVTSIWQLSSLARITPTSRGDHTRGLVWSQQRERIRTPLPLGQVAETSSQRWRSVCLCGVLFCKSNIKPTVLLAGLAPSACPHPQLNSQRSAFFYSEYSHAEKTFTLPTGHARRCKDSRVNKHFERSVHTPRPSHTHYRQASPPRWMQFSEAIPTLCHAREYVRLGLYDLANLIYICREPGLGLARQA